MVVLFLLLACYVPNVAKGSVQVYEISVRRSIEDRPATGDQRPATDDRPTTDLIFGKISNDHISARGRPIHFMFGSTVGFSGSADRMAPFLV